MDKLVKLCFSRTNSIAAAIDPRWKETVDRLNLPQSHDQVTNYLARSSRLLGEVQTYRWHPGPEKGQDKGHWHLFAPSSEDNKSTPCPECEDRPGRPAWRDCPEHQEKCPDCGFLRRDAFELPFISPELHARAKLTTVEGCKDATVRGAWGERDHWLGQPKGGVHEPQSEVWDGERWRDDAAFFDPQSSFLLPLRCNWLWPVMYPQKMQMVPGPDSYDAFMLVLVLDALRLFIEGVELDYALPPQEISAHVPPRSGPVRIRMMISSVFSDLPALADMVKFKLGGFHVSRGCKHVGSYVDGKLVYTDGRRLARDGCVPKTMDEVAAAMLEQLGAETKAERAEIGHRTGIIGFSMLLILWAAYGLHLVLDVCSDFLHCGPENLCKHLIRDMLYGRLAVERILDKEARAAGRTGARLEAGTVKRAKSVQLGEHNFAVGDHAVLRPEAAGRSEEYVLVDSFFTAKPQNGPRRVFVQFSAFQAQRDGATGLPLGGRHHNCLMLHPLEQAQKRVRLARDLRRHFIPCPAPGETVFTGSSHVIEVAPSGFGFEAHDVWVPVYPRVGDVVRLAVREPPDVRQEGVQGQWGYGAPYDILKFVKPGFSLSYALVKQVSSGRGRMAVVQWLRRSEPAAPDGEESDWTLWPIAGRTAMDVDDVSESDASESESEDEIAGAFDLKRVTWNSIVDRVESIKAFEDERGTVFRFKTLPPVRVRI
ncbi:hypothetical protein KFL_004010040 [Klebsormidium nitens]|uniref:Uncharacterized protein n=1 Tax=Klebsormidium nitens TaxID=105231 RepID=A0A1Y1IDS7_KLENI|nr:hypothetical protein KFL_004010040 [Klebsormidium nitens]|eukprot:GAQ88112.1 hypothetical protein KFL_004010040 [Klebsormidium nitens]